MQYEAHHRRPLRTLAAVGLAVVGLVFAGCGGSDSEAQRPGLDRARDDDHRDDGRATSSRRPSRRAISCARLAARPRRPGETLSGEGPFTVFAPTDEAFEAVPQETLDALAEDRSC